MDVQQEHGKAFCLNEFTTLRRAPGTVWSAATKKRAPHKPLLLLCVIDLIARGTISSSFIDVTGNLVELNDLFTGYWRKVVPPSQTSSIAFPFSRMHNEPFWKLAAIEDKELDRAVINDISAVSQLREVTIGARIDEPLFLLLQHPESRNMLQHSLLASCFSDEAQAALIEQANINADAYSYNQELLQRSHQPLVEEALAADNYKAEARDQGLRRAVVNTYDHRCALCGIRIITSEGHTAVDAAHIIPWSISKNDDIRNGMALCKLCHWAFDEGIMGVSDGYTVITSPQINLTKNVPGLLMTLADRAIIPPVDRDLWPAQRHLKWHRQQFRL
jgi:putative restriction endonuclease